MMPLPTSYLDGASGSSEILVPWDGHSFACWSRCCYCSLLVITKYSGWIARLAAQGYIDVPLESSEPASFFVPALPNPLYSYLTRPAGWIPDRPTTFSLGRRVSYYCSKAAINLDLQASLASNKNNLRGEQPSIPPHRPSPPRPSPVIIVGGIVLHRQPVPLPWPAAARAAQDTINSFILHRQRHTHTPTHTPPPPDRLLATTRRALCLSLPPSPSPFSPSFFCLA